MTSREAENQHILATLAGLVDSFNRAMPGPSEVVLHDLAKLPDSIVAIAGSLTGRAVGGPATDMLLRAQSAGRLATRIGYETSLEDGRLLRSSTLIVTNSADEPVAALCINSDVTMWRTLHEVSRAMLPGARWPGELPDQSADPVPADAERFVHDIDELAEALLRQTIGAVGVPIDLMQKKHKLAVVADLKDRGFFMLKESIERAAGALLVSRFTIYNYLNELDAEAEPGD